MNAPLPVHVFEPERALSDVSRAWDEDIVRQLQDYIAIPAKSPMFDPQWAQHGYIDTVVRNAAAWVEAQKVAGLRLEVIRLEGRTPVLFFEVPASRGETNAPLSTHTVLMYGHLDKQPEFSGWRSDLGPWAPRYEDGYSEELVGGGGKVLRRLVGGHVAEAILLISNHTDEVVSTAVVGDRGELIPALDVGGGRGPALAGKQDRFGHGAPQGEGEPAH